MKALEFRQLALALPGVSESAHMDHPDFRVGGKVFATLGPGEEWGMVKVPPETQASLVREEPTVFEPFNGAWGRQGCTKVVLAMARKQSIREAMIAAWRNTAPERLLQQYDHERG